MISRWFLPDGRIFCDPDEFMKVLSEEGEMVTVMRFDMDESSCRYLEKWVLQGMEFWTEMDLTLNEKENLDHDGVHINRVGPLGPRHPIQFHASYRISKTESNILRIWRWDI